MAKLKKDKKPVSPPMLRMEGPSGMVIYPKMKQQPDGSWEIACPEKVKGLLQGDGKGEKE
jgi:hypothetical protein